MAKVNSFDLIVDKLITALNNVKDFQLMAESEHGKRFVNLSVIRQAEIREFKTLFVSHFIPKASMLYVETRNNYLKSKYKGKIFLSEDQLKENVYETIRLGYVGMYHKYESYVTDLIQCAELNFSEMDTGISSLEKYVKENFSHELSKKKGKYDKPIIQKLNWIADSIKHFDGFPKPDYKPKYFENYPTDKRLIFTKEDFVKDIDLLIEHYLFKMQIVFFLAQHKMLFGSNPEKLHEQLISPEYIEKLEKDKMQLDETLRLLIEL
jgi:predicted nucleic-acid-binding protein